MWNFQKEVVLNSLNNVEVVEGTNKGLGKPAIDKKVRFHDGGEYFAKYIVDHKIYETDPIDPLLATVTLDANQIAQIRGTHVQIVIELGLDNDYRGDFGSALWYFRKPVVIDVETKGLTDKSLADAFNAAIPASYKFLGVYTSKSTDIPSNIPSDVKAVSEGKVLLVAQDCYIKVRTLQIVEFTCESRCEGESEEPVDVVSYRGGKDSELTGTDKNKYGKVTKNNVEFGTYEYLLHNLRLPTCANLRFTSPSAPEMPVPGVKYTQFSFAYCVPRGIHFGGLSVAGQTNHSTTLHTFFVASTLVEDFKNLFKGIGFVDDDFESIGRNDGQHEITILPDAYASSQDLANAAAIKENSEADADLKSKVRENRSAIKKAHAAEGADPSEAQGLEDIE